MWATYSKLFNRSPVVIDQYWQSFSLSLLPTALPEVVYNPPGDRDRIGHVGGI